jgi:hypothetical protein
MSLRRRASLCHFDDADAEIGVGLWLLLRNQVSARLRSSLAIVGLTALVLVGFMVATAGLATVTVPAARFAPFAAMPVVPMFRVPPVQESVVLSAPMGTGDILRFSNPSGRTTVDTNR